MMLNEQIKAYLAAQVPPIVPAAGDYTTGQEEDGADEILIWNTQVLGAQPSAGDLAAVSTLYAAKQAKLRAAGIYFSGLFSLPSGFTFNAKLYQIDYPVSQDAITAMGADADRALAGRITWDPAFVFIAADNARVAMDASTMVSFSQGVADYVRKARYRFRDLKDAIAAAADLATLTAIDETSGYPTASA